MLSVIIDPAATGDTETYLDDIEQYRDFILESRLRSDVDRILVPGQPEEIARAERAGGFEIDSVTFAQLTKCAERAGLSQADIGVLLSDTQ